MSELNWTEKDLGPIDAYAYAVENGYFSGTREQWYAMISGATHNASDAEAYAKGTRAGEAVASDDPAYNNNSSYWNDQAGDNAENAEAFANGTRGGEDVDSDDPAYNKNGKYWEGQAKLQKEAAQAAAATASAAYNVNLLAPNYDATATYAVGAHVIYSGGYYECISAISTAEAWTSGHWRQLTVGGEATDLKSAINADESQIFEGISASWENGGLNVSTGEFVSNNSRIRTLLPDDADMINMASDYFVTVLAFSGSTYIGVWNETTFKKEGYRIKHNIDVTLLRQYDYEYWLMCGKDNNGTITPSDGSNVQIFTNLIDIKILKSQQEMMFPENVSWEQGQFNVTTGEFSTVATRIRAKIDPITTGINIADNAYLTIGAWSGDTYIGVWNGKEYKKEGCRLHGRIDTHFLSKTNYDYWVFGGLDNGGNVSPSDSGNFQILYVDISGRLEDLETQTFGSVSGEWLYGGFNVTTGEYLSVNYRIRKRLNRNAIKITAKNGIFATILAFSGSEYIGVWNGEEFKKEGYRITEELDITPLLAYQYDYWIMAGKTSGGEISYAEGNNIGVICNKPLYVSDERYLPFSQCPNIIFQCRNVDNTKFPPESKWYVKAAAENQYDRVRFTVRRTIEGDYFLCHDETINNVARNMDGTPIVESVSTINQSLEVLNSYDWGIKYGEQYSGATVPMLEDSLKWAALFNMGVTWHSGYYDCQTPEAIAEQLAMIDKYGLTDNLIAIVVGSSPDTLKIFTDYNPRISVYLLGALGSVQGAQDFTNQTTLEKMSALQTPYNKIYVQPAPFGTKPSAEFIAYAKQHNWVLYDSITQTLSAFCDDDMFSRGYGIREVENVYMIKDTLRKWVNNMF